MIYFASDVHLGSGSPTAARAIERKFVAWLDMAARDAEAIVLAGDIFDFWFEYRRIVPKGFVRVLGKLAELTDRGVRVVLITGNHDMWVGDYFARECGMEVHTLPQVLTLHGRRIFIAHGDNMQIDGKPILKLLNRIFRSRRLRWLFAWLIHPDMAVRFGRWWSGKSRKSHRNQGAPDIRTTEPLIEYARNYAAVHADRPVDHFVFGHMHAARDFRDGALHTVHLGCWKEIPTYAVLHNNGELTLERFEPATDNRNAEDL
ncbi:MAG: UDP-2,3-diacylglucosamine diphosphatase [Alistipes sp.]|nr:UDP-2,3-diacylglucosamine diphosphatase [Alistipes sp.]